MLCPRCRTRLVDDSEGCPRCGAPLKLRSDPAPAKLDRDLDLDRRGDAAPRPVRPAPAAPDRAGQLRSTPRQWTLPEPGRSPAPRAPEPPAAPADEAAREGAGSGGFEILGPIEGEIPGPPHRPGDAPWALGEGAAHRPTPVDRDLAPAAHARHTPPIHHRMTPVVVPRPEQVALPFPPEVHLRRAPSWRRLLSWLADGTLAAALSWLLVAGGSRLAGAEVPDAVLLPPAALLAAVLHFAHAALGHGLAGRTLGKWMLGLVLVGRDGRRPSPGRCAARALLSLLSVALLGLGLLLALFDRKGRALHDLAAGTAVVRAP